jgi:organic radical activating enzyme
MPLYFNALVVENTSRCNAKCAMCYQSAGPQGSDVLGKASLTVDEIKTLLDQAKEIETIHPRFHLTGGEAFLDVDSVVELIAYARSLGFLDLTTTTNAYWANKMPRAREICRQAHEAGMTSMEISWDFWHQPYIPAEAVSNCVLACYEFGIESNLRLLSSKTHTIDEALSALTPQALELVSRITCGPVFPTGRAAKTLDPGELYSQGTLNDNCHTYLNLTVNARGSVFPCCAGIDQTTGELFGNIREVPLNRIVQSMNRSPMLRTIVFAGIGALVPVLEEAGRKIGSDYKSICHLCWSIFSDANNVRALEEYYDGLRAQAIAQAIAKLEAQEVAAVQ